MTTVRQSKEQSAMQSAVQYAIDLQRLTKRFRRHTAKRAAYTTIKEAFISRAGLRSLRELFGLNGEEAQPVTKAVDDVTLRIPQGASVGIIGRNGSGKSTLLKLITGIYKPDAGCAKVNGRLAALIELGAGFHPDFTGRENLYLGGVMHGLTRRQIDQRLDQIVDFAELADVIDDPVRTYSSGMFMRLGFSLAVHTDPDILLVDEVLAVGDASFVSKCKERLAALRRCGKTLLLVTHDLDAVERWCDEALWLEAGRVRDRGEPRRVIDHYREFIEKGEEQEIRAAASQQTESTSHAGGAVSDNLFGAEQGESENGEDVPNVSQRWGSREIEIVAVRLRSFDSQEKLVFHPDDPLIIEIEYVFNSHEHEIKDIVFGICITRSDGVVIFGSNTAIDRKNWDNLSSRGIVSCSFPRLGLQDGRYRLDAAVHRSDGYPYDYRRGLVDFAVRWPEKHLGVILPQHSWSLLVSDTQIVEKDSPLA